jgi:hypothetical protein
MDTNFIKDLIAGARESWVIMENGGQEIKITFPKELSLNENQERKIFIAELFQEIFRHKLKIKNFSFKLKNKEGSEFIFDLNDSDTRLSCAAKNGTLSLYLNPAEVARLQNLSGQIDNKTHRVAIFAFDPQNLKDLNYTIFYTSDLVSCVIENS